MLANPATTVVAGFVLLGTFVVLPDARPGGGGSAIKGVLTGISGTALPVEAVTLHIDLSTSPPTVYDLDRESASEFASRLADHAKAFVIVDIRASQGVGGTYAPTVAWDTVSVATRTALFTRPAPHDHDTALDTAARWWIANQPDEQRHGRTSDVATRIAAGGSAEFGPIPAGYVQNASALISAVVFFASGAAVLRRGIGAFRAARESRRRALGLCPACQYPLHGAERCPECGRARVG